MLSKKINKQSKIIFVTKIYCFVTKLNLIVWGPIDPEDHEYDFFFFEDHQRVK